MSAARHLARARERRAALTEELAELDGLIEVLAAARECATSQQIGPKVGSTPKDTSRVGPRYGPDRPLTANAERVREVLRDGPSSRPAIEVKLGMSTTSVRDALRVLTTRKMAADMGPAPRVPGSIGRGPRLYGLTDTPAAPAEEPAPAPEPAAPPEGEAPQAEPKRAFARAVARPPSRPVVEDVEEIEALPDPEEEDAPRAKKKVVPPNAEELREEKLCAELLTALALGPDSALGLAKQTFRNKTETAGRLRALEGQGKVQRDEATREYRLVALVPA